MSARRHPKRHSAETRGTNQRKLLAQEVQILFVRMQLCESEAPLGRRGFSHSEDRLKRELYGARTTLLVKGTRGTEALIEHFCGAPKQTVTKRWVDISKVGMVKNVKVSARSCIVRRS
jgi:hypothetical protein